MARILPSEGGDDLTHMAREYIALSKMIDDLTVKRNALKSALSDVVDSTGEGDENGHRHLKFVEPISGIRGFKRERRVSRVLDMGQAYEILADKGLLDECMRVVSEIDQDAIMAAVADERLSAEDVEAIFEEHISWAFKTVK